MNKNLETLTRIIREQLPKLMQLEDGCQVEADGIDKEITIGKEAYEASPDGYLIDLQAPAEARHKYRKITKIIGKEPQLNHVLSWFKQTISHKIFDYCEIIEKWNLESIYPVSYTHLDVYKRQDYRCNQPDQNEP